MGVDAERLIGEPRPVRDAVQFARRGLAYVLTAPIPSRADTWVSRRIADAKLRIQPKPTRVVADRMQRLLGPAAEGLDLEALAREWRRMNIDGAWGGWRAMHRDAWRPEVALDGAEHLEAALERGRGAILWRMSFCSTVVPKMALWNAGFQVAHLSTAGHGASGSWIGRRWLSPLVARSENWYLAERIVIPSNDAVAYIRVLMDRLNRNQIVSMYGDRLARQNVVRPFLTGRAAYATGAPTLAHRLGSALLPVSVAWEGRGRYRVTIHPPIEPPREADREAFTQLAVEEFSKLLQARVLAHPESWAGWLMESNWDFAPV